MAAQLTSHVRLLTVYSKDESDQSGPDTLTPLITPDLLTGGSSKFTHPQEAMFIQRSNVQDFNNHQTNQTVSSSSSSSSPPSPSPRSNYQSVCTLDKVKSALERADKNPIRKRSSLWKSSPSPSYSSSSSSAREFQEQDNFNKSLSSSSSAAAQIAVGCPGCLSYVLVMKNNPTCPRCRSVVALPAEKKPRLDLNISI
ncbi:uncharacterized protein LOC111795171 [Cucurbita pepo subsp. pepo]|uniref:uncharacterized protein LOC111795171 n=1 Tax=Cucurbita pepo subsp. pepo TaxID=3664 RepID=UPI000C9D39E4|nr:uncharacterized protein LOC111795171 [Cucurbita pepo subsp. pepo]